MSNKDLIFKIVLGTVQFGLDYGINNDNGQVSLEESKAILREARAYGIDEIDTADEYGNVLAVLADFHKTDKSFKIMSKFIISDNSSSVRDKVDACLRELNIDSLWGYYFHRFKDFYDCEMFEEISQLKKDNKITNLGVSIYSEDEFVMAIESPHVDVIQTPFNLLDNYSIRGNAIDLAKKAGKKIYVRSVFLQGLFFLDDDQLTSTLAPLKNVLRKIRNIAKQNDLSIQQLALGYALSIEGIDKVIIGVDSRSQLISNLDLNYSLSRKVLEEIDDIGIKDQIELLNPANWS